MRYLTIFLGYLKWHYGKALLIAFLFWRNILVFLFNFFSIKILLKDFFTPWKRLADSYPKHFDIKAYFFTFIANTLMRIVGMVLRAIVLFVGIISCAIFIILLPVIYFIWIVSPFVVLALILYGLATIISSILVLFKI